MSNIEEDKVETLIQNWNKSHSSSSAKSVIVSLVQIIGPGFHPDTQFNKYVSLDDESHAIFSSQMASQLECLLDEATDILEKNGLDPCEIALPAQRHAMDL